ncbi:hypothetical protein HEAR0276 [Herminiimonas arsenicoxydans]|uniref:Uncharacterized protein n=1 Tax=Herminiimonas arsenicoxydans TaxID=204773 RepID=A4G1W6_HERAR|nr:hypothetical protein HEAR0276 [Herminiimonas arsenicoxydans]
MQMAPALQLFIAHGGTGEKYFLLLINYQNMARTGAVVARRSAGLWGIILGSVQNCLFISFD